MHVADYAVARCPSIRPSVCLSLAGRVKIAGGYGGWTPTGKQITPTANAREKARGSGFDPPLNGPDSCECIYYDIVSFSLFILQCFHNLFCTIFMFIFIVSLYAACC